jgi:hypothetical protein
VVDVEGANGHFVVRVLSSTPGGFDLLNDDERRELADRIRGSRASEELQAYLEHLRENARVTIFEQSLQQQ